MTNLLIDLTDWALKSTVAVALAAGCALIIRRRSAAATHLVWRTALVAIALLPVAMALVSKTRAPVVMEPIQAPIRVALAPLEAPQISHPVRTARFAAILADPSNEPESGQVVCWAYIAGLALLLGSWISSYLRIRRIANTAFVQPALVSTNPVLLATDPQLCVPVTFGLFRPVILLPKEAEYWPEERTRAAILHESAHILRRDWAWQAMAAWVRATQWFNPAVWLLASAMNRTSEAAADDEVLLSFGISATAYAGELVNVAEAAQMRLIAATAMARPGGVASRVKRIVAKGIDRRRPGSRLTTAFASLFAVAGLAISAGTIAQAAVHFQAAEHFAKTSPAIAPEVPGVRLKQGGFLRVAFVEGGGNAGPKWRPDGSPASQADIELFRPLRFTSDVATPPGKRLVAFNYLINELHCKPGDNDSVIYRIKGNTGAEYYGGAGNYSGERAINHDQWLVPSTLDSVDIDCLIASKPFETVMRGTIGDAQLPVKVGPRETGEHAEPDPKNPGKWITTHTYDESQTELTIVVPASLDGKDVRVRAYDASGKFVPSNGGPIGPAVGNKTLSYNYDRTNPNDIVGVEVQSRDLEHVTLTGVLLKPYARP